MVLRVIPDIKGLMTSGASVWPMKIFAEQDVVSEPEVPITFCTTRAITLTIGCITPKKYSNDIIDEKKITVGKTQKAKVFTAGFVLPITVVCCSSFI